MPATIVAALLKGRIVANGRDGRTGTRSGRVTGIPGTGGTGNLTGLSDPDTSIGRIIETRQTGILGGTSASGTIVGTANAATNSVGIASTNATIRVFVIVVPFTRRASITLEGGRTNITLLNDTAGGFILGGFVRFATDTGVGFRGIGIPTIGIGQEITTRQTFRAGPSTVGFETVQTGHILGPFIRQSRTLNIGNIFGNSVTVVLATEAIGIAAAQATPSRLRANVKIVLARRPITFDSGSTTGTIQLRRTQLRVGFQIVGRFANGRVVQGGKQRGRITRRFRHTVQFAIPATPTALGRVQFQTFQTRRSTKIALSFPRGRTIRRRTTARTVAGRVGALLLVFVPRAGGRRAFFEIAGLSIDGGERRASTRLAVGLNPARGGILAFLLLLLANATSGVAATTTSGSACSKCE